MKSALNKSQFLTSNKLALPKFGADEICQAVRASLSVYMYCDEARPDSRVFLSRLSQKESSCNSADPWVVPAAEARQRPDKIENDVLYEHTRTDWQNGLLSLKGNNKQKTWQGEANYHETFGG